jgi:protein CpxP
MKKLLLVCAFVAGISTISLAQGGGRGRMKPEDQVAALKTSLTLTDDQSAKVLAILTAGAKVTDSIRTAANGDFQAARPAMTAARKKSTDKILALLTADQATIYKKQLDDQAKAMLQDRVTKLS